jgi:AraC family transcriptional regulator
MVAVGCIASPRVAEVSAVDSMLNYGPEIVRYDGARRSDDEPRRGGLAPWQTRRLEYYIGVNLSGDLTLSGLAALIGVSVRHLSRVVRQTKGVSVHRWITDCRISEARRLLGETDLPIQEIARRVAFGSAEARSRRRFGPPPALRRANSGS